MSVIKVWRANAVIQKNQCRYYNRKLNFLKAASLFKLKTTVKDVV